MGRCCGCIVVEEVATSWVNGMKSRALLRQDRRLANTLCNNTHREVRYHLLVGPGEVTIIHLGAFAAEAWSMHLVLFAKSFSHTGHIKLRMYFWRDSSVPWLLYWWILRAFRGCPRLAALRAEVLHVVRVIFVTANIIVGVFRPRTQQGCLCALGVEAVHSSTARSIFLTVLQVLFPPIL